ncbi:MAG: proteasome accessory factor PafA2 family protein [Chthoniobacter sp.]
MNRIVGIETEYGCLVSTESGRAAESWPARVKNHLFKKGRVGMLDQHYRDYEEPPGNGGFLLNGGRIYLDMGHLEYATPECRTVDDVVAYDIAGDTLVQAALDAMGVADEVAFLKNNIDHHTGATFGCHENYLMHRETAFTNEAVGGLLSFLATRQIYSGAGRVGQASPQAFEVSPLPPFGKVDFQISQRADHIMNDIYQWVQFNRAIINARDEPLADYRKYRRLHLLIGDSNMSPFATALKVGTTHLVLTLLEEGRLPRGVLLEDPVMATRSISHAGRCDAPVLLEDHRGETAIGIQERFLAAATECLAGRDEETDWIIEQWSWVLDALRTGQHEELIGAVDWVSKKWLLESFRAEQNLEWNDPWLQSLDLEYHNLNPSRGFILRAADVGGSGAVQPDKPPRERAAGAAAGHAGVGPRRGRGAAAGNPRDGHHQLGFAERGPATRPPDERSVFDLRGGGQGVAREDVRGPSTRPCSRISAHQRCARA